MAGIVAKVFTGDFKPTARRGREKSEQTLYIESVLADTFRDSQAREFTGDYEADKFAAKVRLIANKLDLSVSVRESASGSVVVTHVRAVKGMTEKVQELLDNNPEKPTAKAATPKPQPPKKAPARKATQAA